MIKIDNFEKLNKIKKTYSNKYIIFLLENIIKSIYIQSNNTAELFDLNRIVEGNGPLYVCENKRDIETVLNSIYKKDISVTWCIKHTVTRMKSKSFFQIGVIERKQFCIQYMIQIKDFDKSYLNNIEQMITSSHKIIN